MTIPNVLTFARNYQIPNTKLSPPLLLHCAPPSSTDVIDGCPLSGLGPVNGITSMHGFPPIAHIFAKWSFRQEISKDKTKPCRVHVFVDGASL